jgi:hypothetical protein
MLKKIAMLLVSCAVMTGTFAQQSSGEGSLSKPMLYTVLKAGSTTDLSSFHRAAEQYSWWQLMELDRRVQAHFTDGTVIELISLQELKALGSTIDLSTVQKPHLDISSVRFVITPEGDVVIHKEK